MMMSLSWSRLGCTAVTWLLLSSVLAVEGQIQSTALQPRQLEDSYSSTSSFQYDLSQFSLRFEKCQYVKMFDDDLAEDENYDSPLATRNFVAYRLCPSDSCSTCNTVYGRYVVEVDTYLENVLENQEKYLETLCENCADRCNTSDDSCSECGRKCYRYENYAADGYVDAANYVECQQLERQGDDDNGGEGDGTTLYVGPRCSYDGTKIVIGVFSDEYCVEPVSGANVEELLNAKLSYHLFGSHMYSSNDSRVCLSCAEADDEEDQNENDQNDADDVNEMCENLYNSAAKCESKTGLEYGFIQTAKDNDQYENQVENEYSACTFIESVLWNSYTETGEIDVGNPQDEIIRVVTNNQAVVLSGLVVTMFGLFFVKAYFDRKLEVLKHPLAVQGNHAFT
jgi:hypothetical protein